jgi:hypothetical protein
MHLSMKEGAYLISRAPFRVCLPTVSYCRTSIIAFVVLRGLVNFCGRRFAESSAIYNTIIETV